MAEEITPTTTEAIQDQIAKMGAMFSGGVVNPLAKEQTRIEMPDLPQAPVIKPELPGGQIPRLSGQYNGELNTPVKYAQALKNHLSNADTWAKDQYKYGKNYSYDADYTGLNFQRYYNAPRVYKEVGFSPWRDNEKIYNDKMNWWDSFKRSAGQATHLAGTGFTSMLPWNAWDGDDTDEKGAKDMERAHAIGADNRGGAGAFFNNLMLDSGYTLGIGAEFAAEELVLWGASTLAAPFTGGASWAAAGAETASQGLKLSKLLKNLGTFGKVLTNTHEGLAGLKDMVKAREVYNYIKSGKPVGQLMDIITPQTAKFAQETFKAGRAAKAAKTGENIYTLGRAAKGVGAFYRDARELSAVLSESKLEGGSVELEMRNKLTDDFYAKNGRMPNATEYQEIYQNAHDAGRETYLYNLPALWISNKIVFDKAFKGFKPLEIFRKELSEGLAGKLVFDEAARKAGGEAWKAVKTGMIADAKSLFLKETWHPKNLLRNGLGKLANYTNKNLTEALQEQYQEAVSASMKEYYESRFSHPMRSSMHEAWGDIFAKNLGKQFTTTGGWETFASGFLMGALVQVPQHIVYQSIPEKFSQITDPEGFQKYKADRQARTDNVVAALNAITKDPNKFFNPNVVNAVSQGILNQHAADAAMAGDTKLYGDIKDESVFEHIHTLLQTDKLSLVTDMLKDMKQLSGEELEQAYGKVEPSDGDAKQYYGQKIDSMLERVAQIERRSKFIEDKYGNPFNPHRYAAGKDEEKYNAEYKKWQAWEYVKKQAVFSGYSFDRSVERMKSITDDLTKERPVAEAPAHDFTVLLDQNMMLDEMRALTDEIEAAEATPGSKREAGQKRRKLEALKDFAVAVKYYRDVLKSNSKATEDTEENRKLLSDALADMHKSFKGYVNVIAKNYDTYSFNRNIDSAFNKIKDHYHLKNDSTNLASVVNLLENPELFTLYAQRAADVAEQLHNQRADYHRKSITDKTYAEDYNQLLNGIMEEGVYIYPDDIKKLHKEFVIPTKFYNVTTGETIEPGSDKYKKVEELINKYVLANKPEQPATGTTTGETTEKPETKKTEGKLKVTPKIAFETLDKEHPELITRLIEGYKTFNKEQYAKGDAEKPGEERMLTPDALTMTDAQIKAHPSFKSFIGLPSGIPADIFREYNKEKGLTVEPEVIGGKAQAAKPAMNIPTVSMKAALKELGYSDKEILKFNYKEAERIINNEIKPGSEAAAKLAAQAEVENARKVSREKVMEIINSQLEKVNSITTLEEFEDAMGDLIVTDEFIKSGINSDVIQELIDSKKEELRVTFEDLKEGDPVRVVGYKDIMVVDKKTDTGLSLHKFGDPTFTIFIGKEKVKDQINFREGLGDISVEASDIENEDINNTTQKRNELLSDPEQLKKLQDEAKDKNDEDLISGDNCD